MVVCVLGFLRMDERRRRVSANVRRSSLVIDTESAGSHTSCPHTRNTAVPLDLINLNSDSRRSDVEHTRQTKSGKLTAHDGKNSPTGKERGGKKRRLFIPLHLC